MGIEKAKDRIQRQKMHKKFLEENYPEKWKAFVSYRSQLKELGHAQKDYTELALAQYPIPEVPLSPWIKPEQRIAFEEEFPNANNEDIKSLDARPDTQAPKEPDPPAPAIPPAPGAPGSFGLLEVDTFAGKDAKDIEEQVTWARNNLELAVLPEDAPDAGSWGMLSYARDDPKGFMNSFVKAYMPAKKELQERNEIPDEEYCLELIDICEQASITLAINEAADLAGDPEYRGSLKRSAFEVATGSTEKRANQSAISALPHGSEGSEEQPEVATAIDDDWFKF